MSDSTLVLFAVLAGVLIAIPILFVGFRHGGRARCWRCRVWMLPVRVRLRKFPLLPIGQCEGCDMWCLALGRREKKKVAG